MDAAHTETLEKIAKETGLKPDEIHPTNPVHNEELKSIGAKPGSSEHENATIDTPLEALSEGIKAAGTYVGDVKKVAVGGGEMKDAKLPNKSIIRTLRERFERKF